VGETPPVIGFPNKPLFLGDSLHTPERRMSPTFADLLFTFFTSG